MSLICQQHLSPLVLGQDFYFSESKVAARSKVSGSRGDLLPHSPLPPRGTDVRDGSAFHPSRTPETVSGV